MSVGVVKLGVGNTASVMFALERAGADAFLSDDGAQLAQAERIILPGVGAAAHAMALIDAKGLREVLVTFQRPLLGICLGQQLLFDTSEEGDAAGLALLAGAVKRLPPSQRAPAPHMGWSKVAHTGEHALLEGVANGAYLYFVHSYVCPLTDDTLATGEYGGRFAAMVARKNVFGCQFHPERSGDVGARVLQNFLGLPC